MSTRDDLPEQECADRSAARRDKITAAEYRIAARVADAEGDLYLSEVLEQRATNAPAFPGSTDPDDLQADVANWKRRYEETQELLRAGGNTWEATIRDRDEQKARADKAEAKLAKVRAILPRGEAVLGGRASGEDAAYLHGQRSVWRQIRDALRTATDVMYSEDSFREWVEDLAAKDIAGSLVPEVCKRLLAAEAAIAAHQTELAAIAGWQRRKLAAIERVEALAEELRASTMRAWESEIGDAIVLAVEGGE